MRSISPRLRFAMLAVGLASAIAILALSGSLSVTRVRDRLDGLGAFGPPVFILSSALLTVVMLDRKSVV